MNEFKNSYFRRSEEPDRGAPCSRAPAHIENLLVGKFIKSTDVREKASYKQAERKDLPPMGMPGDLQVKEPPGTIFHNRSVFKQDDEFILREALEQFSFRPSYKRPEADPGYIIDAGEIDPCRQRERLAAQNSEPCPPGEIQGLLQPCQILVIAGDGEFPITRADLLKTVIRSVRISWASKNP